MRIIRAARELGIQTIQVYSEADHDSLPVRMADESVLIGSAKASDSYLNIENILTAAEQTKADAVHPGYGFLSENAEFADAVCSEGMKFVGPDGRVIRLMGDKVSAIKIARQAQVPTVPGSDGKIGDLDEAQDLASEIGFPVMIKAAAGGGGRGIRVVGNLDEFEKQALQASAEAQAAFGDGELYIEKFIDKARHLEVQILADGKNMVHCFERECSLQRRRQKVWEEAPAFCLEKDVREALCAAAVRLAHQVNYCGVGTVEFLYDEETEHYYFIEMNTRIQVEHPVTEMITGIDLVREMILIADEQPLSIIQDEIQHTGHAIEVRLNAEDPAQNFLPSPGRIENVTLPAGPGVRFDGLVYSGYSIPPFYDSLIGKLIVWDKNRAAAISRLRRSLDELEIVGVKTTEPLFKALARDKKVGLGEFHTGWLENWMEENSVNLQQP